MLPAIFNNQPIRQVEQNGKLWISLTDCAKATGHDRRKLGQIFESDSLKELIQEELMSQKMTSPNFDVSIDEPSAGIDIAQDALAVLSDLIIANKNDTKELSKGTWLDITNELGQAVLIEVAQQLSPKFRRWCNRHIRQLIQHGITISESATLAQLDLAEQELANFKNQLALSEKRLASRNSEAKRLGAKLAKQWQIDTEEQLNNSLHALYAKLGFNNKSEHSFKTSLGIARFDSLSFGRNVVTVYEYKIGWINYAVANNELFGDKQYFKKCKELWPTKQIRFKFVGKQIDEEGLRLLAEHMAGSFGESFRLDYCKLDSAYFSNLQRAFVNKHIDAGLTFTEAERAWLNSGCAQLTEALLA